MPDLSRLRDAILNGDEKLTVQLARKALDEGVDPVTLITQWMIPAMDEVGRLFEAQEYYIPEMLLAARAMKSGMELLRPMLAARGAQPTGRIVLGTVKGDLHDIGKNLVGSMLEGAGFEVFDIGIDVSPEKFIEAIQANNPHILALSALLTITMPEMKKVITALSQAGIRGQVKVLVGGAPVTQKFANEIGADGYGENAGSAVSVARALMLKQIPDSGFRIPDSRLRLIVALDVADRAAALQAVDRLSGHVGYFKLGLEIFTREGPRLVEEIQGRGEKIFLDLKLHDIPNTVRGAVRSACRLGVQMLTVHASGGPARRCRCRRRRGAGGRGRARRR